jgi:hypothetical protein
MISALHLLWIVPLSVWFGFFIAAALTVGKRSDGYEYNPNETEI